MELQLLTNTTPTNPSCLIYGDQGGETLWIGHPNHTQGIQLRYNTIKKNGQHPVLLQMIIYILILVEWIW